MMVTTADGPRAVLTDFGLARPLKADLFETKARVQGGAPYFMAPELFQAKRPSRASDMYAFGLLIDEMVTDAAGVRGGFPAGPAPAEARRRAGGAVAALDGDAARVGADDPAMRGARSARSSGQRQGGVRVAGGRRGRPPPSAGADAGVTRLAPVPLCDGRGHGGRGLRRAGADQRQSGQRRLHPAVHEPHRPGRPPVPGDRDGQRARQTPDPPAEPARLHRRRPGGRASARAPSSSAATSSRWTRCCASPSSSPTRPPRRSSGRTTSTAARTARSRSKSSSRRMPSAR